MVTKSNSSSRSARKLASAVGAAIAVLSVAAPSFGSLLMNFAPAPGSQTVRDIDWSTSVSGALHQLPGIMGNGDGTLPLAQQTAGGLQITVPAIVTNPSTGLPYAWSSINSTEKTTTFYDVSLEMTSGFAAAGYASSSTVTVSLSPLVQINVISQPLSTGTFRLKSGDGSVTLLEGSAADGLIVGYKTDNIEATTASVQSTTVTYSGGDLFSLLANPNGTLSWSLTGINAGAGGLIIDGTSQKLAPFSANMTGLFTAELVPEPAGLGLLAVAALGLFCRRRKA